MVGMKTIEIKKTSMINLNRISTTSMPNVNLIKHNNNTDVHFLPLNIFDDSYASNRTLMVRIYTRKLVNLTEGRRNSRQYCCVYETRYYHSYIGQNGKKTNPSFLDKEKTT